MMNTKSTSLTGKSVALTDLHLSGLEETYGWERDHEGIFFKGVECGSDGVTLVCGSNDSSTPAKYHLRGIVMNRAGEILSGGSPIPKEIVADDMESTEDGLKISLRGETIAVLPVASISPFVEGFYLTIIHNPAQGIFEENTWGSLDLDKGRRCRWNSVCNKTFFEMRNDTGLPSGPELIAMSKGEGFVMQVHVYDPEVASVTRQQSEVPYAIVMSCSDETLEARLKERFGLSNVIPAKVETPTVFGRPSLSSQEAADFLRVGYYDSHSEDPRLGSGEAVMLTTPEGHLFKIVSVAMSTRLAIRTTEANMPFAYHKTAVQRGARGSDFLRDLSVEAYSGDDLEAALKVSPLITVHPAPETLENADYATRQRSVFTAFVWACAPCHQARACKLLQQAHVWRTKISSMLMSVEKTYADKYPSWRLTPDLSVEQAWKMMLNDRIPNDGIERRKDRGLSRCVNILSQAVRWVKAHPDTGHGLYYRIRSSIEHLVNREFGDSLYAIARLFEFK